MDARPGGDPAVLAGVVAGIAGLVVFLVLHHLWIVPIWFIAPAGVMLAALGGAAVGAAYAALRPVLPRGTWTVAAVVAVVGAVLAPSIVVAEVTGPMFAMAADGSGTLLVSGTEAAVDVAVGLFVVTIVAGGFVGALVGRTRRAATTTAVAGLALAAGPGHNIPFLGGTSVVMKELAILATVVLVSTVVLVVVEGRLARRATERANAIAPGDPAPG